MAREFGKSTRADTELLHLAAQGDKQAFAEFCSRTLPTLHRLAESRCRRYGLSTDHAQDAVQEAILAALTRIQAQNLSSLSLAYLAKAVANKLIDYAKNNSKSVQWDESRHSQFGEYVNDGQKFAELLTEFEMLTTSERHLLESVFMMNMKPSEVAVKLGVSKWAVYKQLERLLTRLKNER